MAIPSNDAILAQLKGKTVTPKKVALPSHAEIVSNLGGSFQSLPKPQMTNLTPISQTFEGNTGTMGKKTFADYTPAIQNAPPQIQEGIQRMMLADTEGNIIPNKPAFTFAPPQSIGGVSTQAVPSVKQQSALAFFSHVLDRAVGGAYAPLTQGATETTEKVKIGNLDLTLPKKFSEQTVDIATKAYGPKYGPPIGIALGILSDFTNLATGPGGAAAKVAFIRDTLDAKNAVQMTNVLRKAKIPEALIPQWAEAGAKITDQATAAKFWDHMVNTLQTTKQAGEDLQKGFTHLSAAAQKAAVPPPGVIANAERIAQQLGIKQPAIVRPENIETVTLYHGANVATAEKIRSGGFIGSREGGVGWGRVSLTPETKVADHYANLTGKGEVLQTRIRPGASVKVYDSMLDYTKSIEKEAERTPMSATRGGDAEFNANKDYDVVIINGNPNIPGSPAFAKGEKMGQIILAKPSAVEIVKPGALHNPLTIGEEGNIAVQALEEEGIIQGRAGGEAKPSTKPLTAEEKLILNDAKTYDTLDEFIKAKSVAFDTTTPAAKARLTEIFNQAKGIEGAATRSVRTVEETARASILEERAAALTDEAAKATDASEKATILQQLKITTDELEALQAEVAGFEKTGIEQAQAAVPRELKVLAAEAKKYETAEAFIKAQTPVFRGSAEAFDSTKVGPGGVFVSPSEYIAGTFGKSTEPLYLPTNAKILEWKDVPERFKNYQGKDVAKIQGQLAAYAKSKGYDVVAYEPKPGYKKGIEHQVVNPEILKTKSQLTDLFNQTTKKTTPKGPISNVNLVKAISAEKKPHAITEMLKDNFPKMSEKTLDVFSQRMAQYTRASDIEGLLSSLQRLANQADETGQRILDATLPESVRSALTPRQAQLNVELLTRQIKTPENSAIAEAEYSALWEHADQRVIDRFNEVNVEIGILEEVIAEHPGKFFSQFRLPGQAYEDMDIAESLAKGLKTGGKNRTIDTYFAEQGVADAEGAQKKLEDFLALRAHLKDLQLERKELKPHVRSAQIVRGMLDELPVVPNRRIGAIDEMANTADIRSTYKDISGFSGGFRDMYRNFEHFFGSRFQDVKEAILDPFDAAKGEYVDRYNAFGDAVKENVVDKFGFKRGSEESKAIQDWGERALMSHPSTANPDSIYHTEEALVAKFGEEKARNIKKAATWFRQEYDRVIDEINDVRKKIYPNNPSKLISKRKDYFRHYQEFGSSVMDAVRSFMDVPSGIDPKLVGISEFTKPKSKFLSLAQLRKGPISERDAIGGFLDYAPAASYAIHIDPQIGVFRYLRRKLAEKAPIAGSTENQSLQPGIDNFLQFLDDFGNNLATKTNPVDRWIQKRIPGGRAAMKAMDWINNRVKANTILGNLGSSFAQMANIPQGIASAKQYSVQGAGRTLASILEPNTAMKESTFLKERYLETLKDRFPIDFKARPIRAGTEAAARVAASFLRVGDQIGTHFIWNSHYAKAVAEEMKNPVKYADDMTRKLVAGRGIGELPVDQQAKITQMLAPFTVEVQNLWWILKDQVKAKDFTGLAILLTANYLFNEVSERTRGSRVVYDPVNALIEGAASLQREAKKGDIARGGMEFAGRQIGEVASNVPFGQDVTAMLPDSLFGMKKTDLFGQGDPNRFGPPVLLAGAIKNPLWRVAPPFGGAQLQKTYNGIVALMQGQATSASGKMNFPIASTPGNITRALLFGPNSTTEARSSFASGDELHQRLASQDVQRQQLATDAEQKWAELKTLKTTKGPQAVAAEWAQIGKDNPQLLTKIKQIAADEEKGLTANDRLIGMLGVANGERASYIADQINSLKTKEQKQALWKDYVTKKLLTPEVQNQVMPLIEGTNTST